MRSDKIFYAIWGLVIIMAGVCAIVGLGFQWDFLSTLMLWLVIVGVILIIVGIITASTDINTAITQIIAGDLLTTITLGILVIHLHLLDLYITFALIIIIIGVSVIAIGMSRKG